MSKFHDYFALIRYSRTSLATSCCRKRSLYKIQLPYPCSGSPPDSTSYWNSLSISLESDWQIDHTFFNRPDIRVLKSWYTTNTTTFWGDGVVIFYSSQPLVRDTLPWSDLYVPISLRWRVSRRVSLVK